MEKRKMGSTDLECTGIGFGTWEMSTTMYGDIDVKVEGQTALDLSTSDGDIIIRVPSGFGAEVDLKGEYVRLGGKVTLEGEVGKRYVSGTLGDGGPRVRARTSDGSVSLRFY